MSAFFDVIAVSSSGPELEDVQRDENVQTFSIEMTRLITPLSDVKALWNLYVFFKMEKPEIVHTHTPKAGLLGMLAALLAKVPVRMHTVAGLPLMESKGVKKMLLTLMEKLTYACATKVYPNSDKLKKYVADKKICSIRKFKVLGNGSSNGIDALYFSKNNVKQKDVDYARSSLDIAPGDFVFIFVGRLVKDKGIEELVRAFIQLKSHFSHAKLLLVGSFESALDPISDDILEIIQKQKDIISVGFQEDIRPYLAISHVLAFPSYREGFPNVPMQAGCFHLPCIVTDINGCNEIIIHNENGLIIPVKDYYALFQAMKKMITDNEYYNRACTIARPMIVERYDQQRIWKLILNEYNQLMEQAYVS